MRATIVEQLMCNFTADYRQIANQHGFGETVLEDSITRLQPLVEAGLAHVSGTTVSVPKEHRLFLRSVACTFDSHYTGATNRHAKAV